MIRFMELPKSQEEEYYPRMPSFSWLIWFVGLLITPFLLPKLIMSTFSMPMAGGPLHESRHVTGKSKNFSFKTPLDLKEIKKACKLEKTTVNSFLTAMISLTLAQYYKSKKYDIP